jgi:hypothetical protein
MPGVNDLISQWIRGLQGITQMSAKRNNAASERTLPLIIDTSLYPID